MSKKGSRNRPEIQTREALPKVKEDRNEAQILCPFCDPPHPLAVGRESACGTSLRVTAVQIVVPARTVHKHNLTCVKCKQSNGVMVKFHQGYVHLHECSPETKLMAEAPQFSKGAQFVYGLPSWIRARVEGWTGKAKQCKEVDPSGKDTGRVLGYFFYKLNGGSNAADRPQ